MGGAVHRWYSFREEPHPRIAMPAESVSSADEKRRMRRDDLLVRARKEAVRVLRECAHPLGMTAAAGAHGYPQVWARDSMITLLGGIGVEDAKVRRACEQSLETLRAHATSRGLVPNNVHVRTGRPQWRAYADGSAWYVIGLSAYVERTDDDAVLRKHWPTVEAALEWYAYQDVQNEGLVSMSEAADWEDLFAVRGRGLTVNVLRVHALRRASGMARRLGFGSTARSYARQATALAKTVDSRFWYDPSRNTPVGMCEILRGPFRSDAARRAFVKRRARHHLPKKRAYAAESFYLPYLGFNDIGQWFDSFGNLAAVVTGLAPAPRAEKVLALMKKKRIAGPVPVKAIAPPIMPGEHDWRDYYRNKNLNLPQQYHNGGAWPFLGGLYVAALVAAGDREGAERALTALAEANRKGKSGEWEFNEWLHGKTGVPMGKPSQAWSAGMFLFADECVRTGKVPFLR